MFSNSKISLFNFFLRIFYGTSNHFCSYNFTFFSTKAITTGIAYNTDIAEPVESWNDLLVEDNRGMIAVPSPLYSGAALNHLHALINTPEIGWDFYEGLNDLDIVPEGGNGPATKAVASGMPKLRIEEAAATRQAMIDRGEDVIVGVNKYRRAKEDDLDIRDIDNSVVRDAQIAALKRIRETRDQDRCDAALAELERVAREDGNLLAAAVEAARARASVGEISMAMEKVFGRHRAEVKTLAGVYGKAYEGDEGFAAIQKAVEDFAEVRLPISTRPWNGAMPVTISCATPGSLVKSEEQSEPRPIRASVTASSASE